MFFPNQKNAFFTLKGCGNNDNFAKIMYLLTVKKYFSKGLMAGNCDSYENTSH